MSDAKVLPEVMPSGWNPVNRGRRPKVSVDNLVMFAEENKGDWISQFYPEESAATSAMRQLNQRDLECHSRREPGGGRTVYTRV